MVHYLYITYTGVADIVHTHARDIQLTGEYDVRIMPERKREGGRERDRGATPPWANFRPRAILSREFRFRSRCDSPRACSLSLFSASRQHARVTRDANVKYIRPYIHRRVVPPKRTNEPIAFSRLVSLSLLFSHSLSFSLTTTREYQRYYCHAGKKFVRSHT